MHVHLKYGSEGLDLDLPETPNFQGVLYPKEAPPLDDPAAAVKEALDNPIAASSLAAVARGRKDAVIVISDSTRPVPNALLLPRIWPF